MNFSVDFILENLKQLVADHYNLIHTAKSELDGLESELRLLKAILKDSSSSTKYEKPAVLMELERQARETVYDVEDGIDTGVTELAMEKNKTFIKRNVVNTNRTSFARQVKFLREEKVKPLCEQYKNMSNLANSGETPDNTTAAKTREIRQKKRQNKIVGMEDEANTLIRYLEEPSDKLEVISIIGMPGLGKTTVAWKIFQDPVIKYEFPFIIWVNISDDLNLNSVLRTILSKCTNQNEADNTRDEDLGEIVRNHLQSVKFLIVMDDVWSPEAWDELKSFLPLSNCEGRVLITSREEKVAFRANVSKPSHNHKLRFLTKEESWELLQYEVYDAVNVVHKDLVKVGKTISENCDGLPLSIVVIGGILKDKISDAHGAVSAIKKEWLDVSTNVETYLIYKDKTQRLEKIIRLSYERLPYELRDCFLYLGVFPEDAIIPVKRLTLLWMAEGFLHEEIPRRSLEEIAHDNLKDLINRNLLMVEKAKPNGEAKVCRVHDSIRQFCRTEAGLDKLNLFKEVSVTGRGVFEPSLSDVVKYRRLCIHSSAYPFFMKKPKVPKARTFLCFSKTPIPLEDKDIKLVIEGFQLLRVFGAPNIKFPKFPQKIVNLIHLRYLTITFSDEMKFIPDAMSNLWNLQTLIVDIPSQTLLIKANIWMMRHLRHLKTRASIVLKNEGKGEGGENLQTLDRLSPESCTDTVFNRATNLNKLGIQGDLNSIVDSNCLVKQHLLTKLKLVHVGQKGYGSAYRLCRLPVESKFPPNLKSLVLNSTYLEWQQMSVLGNLRFLEELKLKENAFIGSSWEAHSDGFHKLELLDIERADVKNWTASEDSFTELRFLSLKTCERLEEVPFALGVRLEMLYLEGVTANAVASARKIKEAKGTGELVLKIAPADEDRKPVAQTH